MSLSVTFRINSTIVDALLITNKPLIMNRKDNINPAIRKTSSISLKKAPHNRICIITPLPRKSGKFCKASPKVVECI
jgi:hypothetical protein